MDMQNVFAQVHGTLDMERLICLADVIEEEEAVQEHFGADKETVMKALEYLEISADTVFRNPDSFIHPINHIKGFSIMDIVSFEMQYLKMFQTKESIAMWETRFNEMERKGDWDSLFTFADKRISLLKFMEKYKEIPKEEIVDIFASVYVRQEFGFHLLENDLIEYVFSHSELSEERKERMSNLPAGDELIVYRGSGDYILEGYSWTLSIDTAEFFANRYSKEGVIYKGKVKKSDVLDYYENRGESEVLVNPDNVMDIQEL